MLEQSATAAAFIDKQVKTHVQRIQDYEWPVEEYECIVGVWSLCYLGYKDRCHFINMAINALKEGGHIVLFEPTLAKDEPQIERPHSNPEQQMIVRSRDSYVHLFQEFGFSRFPRWTYPKFDICNEAMTAFILRKPL